MTREHVFGLFITVLIAIDIACAAMLLGVLPS